MLNIANYKLLLLLLSRFSRVRTLCDPIDSSPPGSPVPGILQARTLDWVAVSFSNAWKWKVKVKSLSRVRLFVTPWTAAYQAPPPMGFSRQEYWSGVLLLSPWGRTGNMQIWQGEARHRRSRDWFGTWFQKAPLESLERHLEVSLKKTPFFCLS